MDEEKEAVSLLNTDNQSSSISNEADDHFEPQPRLILRYSITLVIALSFILMFLAMVLSSSAYSKSNKTAPIIISPYPESSLTPDTYGLYLSPCIYARSSSQSTAPSIACTNGGFCPNTWLCSNVTIDGSVIGTCSNPNLSCYDLDFCANYILKLQPAVHAQSVPASDATIDFNSANFAFALIVILLLMGLTWFYFLYNELWNYSVGDPFFEPPTIIGVGEIISSFYFNKIVPLIPASLISTIIYNTVVLAVALILTFIVVLLFSTGISPTFLHIEDASGCVSPDGDFIRFSSIFAWTIILLSLYMTLAFILYILVLLYTVKRFYKYWNPWVFIVSFSFLFVLFVISVIIELVDTGKAQN